MIRRFASYAAAALLAACHANVDERAIETAALRELFLVREHPRVLVIWHDSVPGPVLSESTPATVELPAQIDGIPIQTVRQPDMAALFRDHPDGWQAFYARYAGALGLVELAPATVRGDSAELLVARSCGEHCRNAWDVALRRAGGQWKVRSIQESRRSRI